MGTDYNYLYVGTYTSIEAPGCRREDACGMGIYRFECEGEGRQGEYFEYPGERIGSDVYPAYNPSYMEFDREHKYLYAVEETEYHGTIICFAVNPDGSLTFRDRYFFRGGSSCHIMITRDNRFLIASDYEGGCITIFERHEDGAIKFIKQHQHEGKGIRADRQSGPHAHSTIELKDGSILTADLGTDELVHLERIDLDTDNARLTVWHEREPWKLPMGSGPRHMELSPNGRFLYVLTELSCEVCVFDLKRNHQMVGRYSVRYRPRSNENYRDAIRDDWTLNYSADIHLSKDGKYLYVSNRGLDSIVVFGVRAKGGILDLQGAYSCGGRGPRSFAISEEHIIIANQRTANVVIYQLNPNGAIGLPIREMHVPRASKVLLL